MPESALAPGAVLEDTYRIVRRIGRGGMGEVYEASHARLSGRYAVKLILGEIAAHTDSFTRFRREAEVTSSLRHPNIVQVIDFNRTPDGMPYLVMEFLDGVELSVDMQNRGRFPVARAAWILRQIASGLTAAHNRGIVHRDLKPSNLFLATVDGEDEGVVKILDFGLSKVKEANTKLTKDSAVIGTVHYMSPEQAQGKIEQVDARSDQFSLGSIVYEMLAGQEPFRGHNLAAIAYQVVDLDPPVLESVNPAVPTSVAAVIRRAMSKKREERFENVREFYRAFAAAAGLAEGDVAIKGQPASGAALTPAPLPVLTPRASVPALAPPMRRKAPLPTAATAVLSKTTFSSAVGEGSMLYASGARWRRPFMIVGGVAVAVVAGFLVLGRDKTPSVTPPGPRTAISASAAAPPRVALPPVAAPAVVAPPAAESPQPVDAGAASAASATPDARPAAESPPRRKKGAARPGSAQPARDKLLLDL